MKERLHWDVQHYGIIIDDYERHLQGHYNIRLNLQGHYNIRLKHYYYNGVFYVEYWQNGICLYFGELFD